MLAVLLFGLIFFLLLAVLLARYGGDPLRDRRRAPSLRISIDRLHALVDELMEAMGLVELAPGGDERWRVMRRDDALSRRVVLVLEADPPNDLVPPSVVRELADEVAAESAAVGVLITPYRIAREGSAESAAIELVDGERLRELVATYLPARLPELARYRGFGNRERPAPVGELAPLR